jgi:hypothetical protein
MESMTRPPLTAILAEVLTPRLLEKWLIALHPDQVAVEERKYNGIAGGAYLLGAYLRTHGLENLLLLEHPRGPFSFRLRDQDTSETVTLNRWVENYLTQAAITFWPRPTETVVPWLLDVLAVVAPRQDS